MLEVSQIQDYNQFTNKFASPSTIINAKQQMVKQLEEQYQTIQKAKMIICQLNTINQNQKKKFEKAKVELQSEKTTQIIGLLEQIKQLEDLNKNQEKEKEKLKQELSDQNEYIQMVEVQVQELENDNQLLKQQKVDQKIFYQVELEEKTKNHEYSLKRIDELACQVNQLQQLQQETQIFNQNQLMESNNLQSQAIPQHEFQQITDQSSKSPSDVIPYEKVNQVDENQNDCQSTLLQNNESKDEIQFLQNQKDEEQRTQIDQTINTNIITAIEQKEEIAQDQMISLNERPYQLINQYTKKQERLCRAIAFNKESTIMVAGQSDNIVVFDFNNGQLNQKQILSGYYVDSFYFMKKENQFISGDGSGNIQIWNYNDTKQQWYCLQLLNKAHSYTINRVIMNKNEDLIISCSDDYTIKFWVKRNEWECYQTLTNHTRQVLSISLNESCTQLVSCGGYDKQILISQQDSEQKWTVIQSIKSNFGYRICFIDDYLIAFQPSNGTEMELYELDQQNKQFVKSKDIPVQNDDACFYFFPMTFHSKKQLLLNKNGFTINLMKKKNNDFVVEQSIKFKFQYVYGAMTDDGEYLVTWDEYTDEFQVRKQL